jgi:hypothetical protein
MTSEQEDKYGMYLKVDLLLVTYATELSFNPNIALTRTALNTLINAIAQADSTATRDITGYTVAKNQHRSQQVALFKKVRAGMMGYLTGNPDVKKRLIVDFSDSDIDKFRDTELYMKTDQVLDIALPVKTLLVPYGVADTDVEALDTLNAAWLMTEPTSRQEIGVNKAARKDVSRFMEQADMLITETLDNYLKVVQYNNPNLYDQYLTARMIDDSGGQSDSTGYEIISLTIPAGGSVNFPAGPGPIEEQVEIYLRVVTQGGGVYVCTTNVPASPCTGGYQLLSGITYKGPIGNLGLDLHLPVLQITNPGLTEVIVRAGVKEEQ